MAGITFDNSTGTFNFGGGGASALKIADDDGLSIQNAAGTNSVTLTATGATLLSISGTVALALENRTSDPGTPAEGRIYWDSTADTLKVYNGATWSTFNPGSGAIDGTLTATRIPFASDANTLTDASTMTFASNTLTLGDAGATKTRVIHNAGPLGDAENALNIVATQSSTAGAQYGIDLSVTSAGTSTGNHAAIRTRLLAGFTGSGGGSFGVLAQNEAAGTATSILGGSANFGTYGSATALTVGVNCGSYGEGSGSSAATRYGAVGYASGGHASATNVGVMGVAVDSSAAIRSGGYFVLTTGGSPVPALSGALVCDNGTTTDAIFAALDNGTSKFKIKDKGLIEHKTISAAAGELVVDRGFSVASNGGSTAYGYYSQATSTGSGSGSQFNHFFYALGSYTGTGIHAALVGTNENGSHTGTGILNTTMAVYGNNQAASGAGDKAGVVGHFNGAGSGAVWAMAGIALGSNTGPSVGVLGQAGNSSASIRTGGSFTLGTVTPVSAALHVSNSSVALPVAVFHDNTTEVFSIQDGGQAVSSTDAGLELKNVAGTSGVKMRVLRQTTTNSATPTEVTIDNSGAVFFSLASGTTHHYTIYVAARGTAGTNSGKSAAFKIEVLVANNAGTTAIVGTEVKWILAREIAAWDVTVAADNTNDRLAISVTGDAASTIAWRGWVTETTI